MYIYSCIYTFMYVYPYKYTYIFICILYVLYIICRKLLSEYRSSFFDDYI